METHTGYALHTQQHGYVCVSTDFFSRALCYWPCSRQESPSMALERESAERAVAWLNTTFPEIGASVVPLRYSNGEWIDRPEQARLTHEVTA